MTPVQEDDLTPIVHQPLWFQNSKRRFLLMIRSAGYLLLLLALLDIVTLLIPLQLMNPLWEFQTMGAIVDRVALPILALVLIFYGENQFRNRWGRSLVGVISWGSLIGGLLLLVLVPLGLINTARIQELAAAQLTAQYQQQLAQTQQAESQLLKAPPQEIRNFLIQQGLDPKTVSPQATKEQLLASMSQLRQQAKNQFEAEQNNRRLQLLKSSAKWNLGALCAGVFLIYVWKLTAWARLGGKHRHR